MIDCPVKVEPSIFFFHIPKTAGSTIQNILRQHFDASDVCPGWTWTSLLKQNRDQLAKFKLYQGHFYGKFELFMVRPHFSFTMLRDPIERALSHYGHVIRDPAHYLHERAIELGGFEAYMEDPITKMTISNFQTRMLALDVDIETTYSKLTDSQKETWQLERLIETTDFDKSEQELQAKALEKLKSFDFVGVTERLDDAIALLCYRRSWVYPEEINDQNVNKLRSKREHLTQETFNRLEQLNQLDSNLYKWAQKNFNEKFKQVVAELINQSATKNPSMPPPFFKMDKFISYASNYEDVILWRALNAVTPGFYVDIGAHHPVTDSVTKAFYERGWRGVNVEPIKDLHQLLVQDRPKDINVCAAAGDASGDDVEFYDVVGTGLSTTDAQIAQRHRHLGFEIQSYRVPMLALGDIYENNKITEVHFLKIDVEGSERQVLLGAAIDKVRPWVVIVEATEPNTQIPTHEQWEYLLTNNSYIPVYFDGVNRYYLDSIHQDLAVYFKAPPNVFDNFIQYQYWDAQRKSEQHARALEDAIQNILSSLSWRLTKPFRAPRTLLKALINRYKG